MVTATHLEKLLVPLLTQLGYELVDIERQGGVLRIFVEKMEHAVTIEDCVFLTHQLERVFLVEGVDYNHLEISSPGLDRVLKKTADYKKFVGESVHIRLHRPIESGQKVCTIKGQILSVQGDSIILKTVEGKLFPLSLDKICKARLVPE